MWSLRVTEDPRLVTFEITLLWAVVPWERTLSTLGHSNPFAGPLVVHTYTFIMLLTPRPHDHAHLHRRTPLYDEGVICISPRQIGDGDSRAAATLVPGALCLLNDIAEAIIKSSREDRRPLWPFL